MAELSAALSSCNGVMGGLYDETESEPASSYGFLKKSDGLNSGRVYVDATRYDQWVYINFHTATVDSCLVADSLKQPTAWDIALHRYDMKTHGGAVMKTSYTELAALTTYGSMPAGDFVPDIWSTKKIITDMSHMMQGEIGYESTWYNPTLDWVKADLSSMPPTYSSQDNVYMIRLADGTCAAIKLVSYMNDASVKGHITFDYIYPLTLK